MMHPLHQSRCLNSHCRDHLSDLLPHRTGLSLVANAALTLDPWSVKKTAGDGTRTILQRSMRLAHEVNVVSRSGRDHRMHEAVRGCMTL